MDSILIAMLNSLMLGAETLYKIKTNAGDIVIKTYENNDIESDEVNICVGCNDIVYFDKDENRIEDKVDVLREDIEVYEEVI